MNTVWFAHGKESGPWGTKITALAKIAEKLGWKVESPDYQGINDPDKRVAQLLELYQAPQGKTVLAGSSMGGYVSLVASQQLAPEGLFLMAPALGIPGYAESSPEPRADQVALVHGWRDGIIPAATVIDYAAQRNLPLQLVDDEHPLSGSLPQLASLFRDFLVTITNRPDAARLAPHL